MNKTAIEWTDYTWNPVTGCNYGCDYCYARKIAERFRGGKAFPNGFEPTFHPARLEEIRNAPIGAKVFVCSMGELFTPQHRDWTKAVLDTIRNADPPQPDVTYQLLTKQPQLLADYNPFPDNCWVGASCISGRAFVDAARHLGITEARVKFISFEPLLGSIKNAAYNSLTDYAFILKDAGINWVIVGSQTNPKRQPQFHWIDEIRDVADMACVPIFMKNNLNPRYGVLRQELPYVK